MSAVDKLLDSLPNKYYQPITDKEFELAMKEDTWPERLSDENLKLQKEIQLTFEDKWKDDMEDINYIDGIVFTLEYLRNNGKLK